jgi:lysozyme|tara:strand:- start:137 stop:559 length:423 start_codon:yes stop_codon:yes gene_type:complete
MSKLIEQLKRHEGVRTHAYQCTANMTTVGVGRNIDEDGGIGLSIDEIEFLLENDIKRCKQELISFPWFSQIDSVRQDALVNLCFNLGMTRLLGFRNALTAMSVGDYDKAADEFMDSRWAKQVGSRAEEVCAMIRTGNYPE